MQICTRKYLIVVLLLLITLGLLVYIDSYRSSGLGSNYSKELFSEFPFAIGEWKGRDVTISQRAYEILETRDVVLREYINQEGESIGLAIVGSASNRGSFHPPEICYAGEGLELLNKSIESIDAKDCLFIKTNKLVLKDDAGYQVAWYWFAVGNYFTHNYYLQQIRLVINELFKIGSKQGALIRVSKRLKNHDLSAEGTFEDSHIKDFISEVAIFLNKLS